MEQQGFVTGRSMDRHLLEVWAKQQAEDKGAWVALDFAKAFDTMSHQLIEAMLRDRSGGEMDRSNHQLY